MLVAGVVIETTTFTKSKWRADLCSTPRWYPYKDTLLWRQFWI